MTKKLEMTILYDNHYLLWIWSLQNKSARFKILAL